MEAFGFRNPSSAPQAPVGAGGWVPDSRTETGAGFSRITLPHLQRKLRFACLSVSEATQCPAYREIFALEALNLLSVHSH